MRRWLTLFLFLLLSPALALAVTEGVVEAAPPVAIQMPERTNALFGVWEQGLADIRLAARSAAMAWADFPQEMTLSYVQLSNIPADTNEHDDTIMVRFLYRDAADGEKLLSIRYRRSTGKLIELTDTMTRIERRGGESLSEDALMAIAMDRLTGRHGAQDVLLIETDKTDTGHWLARFASSQGRYELVIDRQTGEVIRVSLDME